MFNQIFYFPAFATRSPWPTLPPTSRSPTYTTPTSWSSRPSSSSSTTMTGSRLPRKWPWSQRRIPKLCSTSSIFLLNLLSVKLFGDSLEEWINWFAQNSFAQMTNLFSAKVYETFLILSKYWRTFISCDSSWIWVIPFSCSAETKSSQVEMLLNLYRMSY